MFGATVSTRTEMRSVLAQYASAAARRLRAHHLEAALLQVWISSSRFRDQVDHHSHSAALDPPTSDPLALIEAARGVLGKMREGRPYNRAGVMLTGLSPAGACPILWADEDRRPALADAVDKISDRFGRQAIGYGPAGFRGRQRWDMRREHLSPGATTNWGQLLSVR